jgi:hypothetical protein
VRFTTFSSALVACVLSFAACEPSATQTSTTPTPINTSTRESPPLVRPPVNWIGDRVFAVVNGPGARCGWSGEVGDSRTDVSWSISIDGGSIKLDEDVVNWPTDDVPYAGTLSGTHFEASYSAGADYLQSACQWKGGTLTGNFNSDSSRFEATEMLVWGPPENETTVQARWTGRVVMR